MSVLARIKRAADPQGHMAMIEACLAKKARAAARPDWRLRLTLFPRKRPRRAARRERVSAETSDERSNASDAADRRAAATAISTRFSSWMVATRALQGQGNVTFVPVLQDIANLARKSSEDQLISIDVIRVASFYLQKWAGIAPLPGDPPPR